MKKVKRFSPTTRISNHMYSYLKEKSKKRDSSIRFESHSMFQDYIRLKTLESKLSNKKVFMFR